MESRPLVVDNGTGVSAAIAIVLYVMRADLVVRKVWLRRIQLSRTWYGPPLSLAYVQLTFSIPLNRRSSNFTSGGTTGIHRYPRYHGRR
jgi:hypothetical protein